MIVINAQHQTAIVIKRDGKTVAFVRFVTGRLRAERQVEAEFRAEWQEVSYPLTETLARFLDHARAHGGTVEALNGLEKLKARDATVVASLF